MALIEMEGFDWTATGNSLLIQLVDKYVNGFYPWSSVAGSQGSRATTLNSFGGAAMNFNTSNSIIQITPGGTYTTLIWGSRYKFNVNAASVNVISFMDGASAQCGVAIDGNKHLYFWRGTTGTVVQTGTTVLIASATYMIECKVTFSNTGSFDIRLDGVSELSNGSVDTTNTANNSATAVQITGGAGQTTTVMDDFYLLDDTGSAPYKDFLSIGGPVAIETSFVTTDDSVTWTPLSSTNASNVDETQLDSDTTYNSSASTGQVDTFNHGALSSTPATVYAVQVQAALRKDDVTSQIARTKLKSGATTSNGSSFQLVNGIYIMVADAYINDPNTGAAWTGTNINATKIGYEHV